MLVKLVDHLIDKLMFKWRLLMDILKNFSPGFFVLYDPGRILMISEEELTMAHK